MGLDNSDKVDNSLKHQYLFAPHLSIQMFHPDQFVLIYSNIYLKINYRQQNYK